MNTDLVGIGSILVIAIIGGSIGGILAMCMTNGFAFTWELLKYIWKEKSQ